jgi:glycosyltransferase involved in cell wall biosynthesis
VNSISEKICSFQNDYREIEVEYKAAVCETLNSAPFTSLAERRQYRAANSVSVIIPTWNTDDTLLLALRALELSGICRYQPEMLEVVVVDDGSSREVCPLLAGEQFVYRLKIVRQKHSCRACAINTGVYHSTGEIIVFVDADVLVMPYSLDELIKRQQMFPNDAIFFGFRGDVTKEEVDRDHLCNWFSRQIPAFWRDNRFRFDYPDSWGSNMMLETSMLRGRKGSLNLWVCDGKTPVDDCWQLYRMVYGFFFCVSRTVFLQAGGFDEQLIGWGWDDSSFIGKCISLGIRIVPVPSAFAFHIYHRDRTPEKWAESEANNKQMKLLFAQGARGELDGQRIGNRVEYRRSFPAVVKELPVPESAAMRAYLHKYYPIYSYELGNLSAAAEAFGALRHDMQPDMFSMYIDCLIRLRDEDALREVLRNQHTHGIFEAQAAAYLFGLPTGKPSQSQTDVHMEHCMRFLPEQHMRRGDLYFSEGQYYMAFRDYVAAMLTGCGKASQKLDSCREIILAGFF